MTPVGVIPQLPEEVPVTFDTGATMLFPVESNAVTEADVAEETTFIVTGSTIGSLVKANIYVRNDAEVAQITDVWPMTIYTALGVPPVYPEFADVSFNNGGRSNTTVPVVWNEDDKAQVNYNAVGAYTVRGTVQKGEDIAETILTVNVITSGADKIIYIYPVNVVTEAGIPPELPEKVIARYNSGEEKEVSVIWPAIDESRYAKEGTFTVEGTVAGTTIKAQAVVTVLPPAQTTVLAVDVTGPDSVKPGAEFNVDIDLLYVEGQIYGEDITVEFDSSKFEFVVAVEADEEVAGIIDYKTETAGKIRFILASVDGVMGEHIPLLKITFKVIDGVDDTVGTVSVTRAELGLPDGSILTPELDSHDVYVQKLVVKAELEAAINNAQAIYDGAVEGDKAGQYPVGSKAILLDAINAARVVYDNPDATQEEVDQATADLNAAVDEFQAKRLTHDIGDVNKNGQINIGDLAIVAYYFGSNTSSDNWQEAKACDFNNDGKIDILDLAFVALKILSL